MIKRDLLEKSLEQSVESWNSLTVSEIRTMFGESVKTMVGFEQKNPHHCYDLFLHSIHTVCALPEDAPVLVKVAAFLHDIGKPAVAKEKDGRRVFYGHAKKSAQIARKLLKLLEYSDYEIEEICFYITHHDDFISWVLPTESYDKTNPYKIPITEETMRKHFKKVMSQERVFQQKEVNTYEMWRNLLELCRADVMAQAEYVFMNGRLVDSKAHKLDKISLMIELLEEGKGISY